MQKKWKSDAVELVPTNCMCTKSEFEKMLVSEFASCSPPSRP